MNIMIKLLALTALLTLGCQNQSTYRNSSVVDYLYPNSKNHTIKQSIPRLKLPLQVGIAFTPDRHYGKGSLSEKQKMELLTNVKNEFQKIDFIDNIEVIPSAYLRPAGSFHNLTQLKRMFNIDVIALVSFDQTQFTDEGAASLAYWTIIGAYIVPAEKNATHTLLDTVLYDIDSEQLLFRAPGASSIQSNATPINLSEQTRLDSVAGFNKASEDLIANLKTQLELFREKAKSNPERYKIVKTAGYSGGGNSELFLLLIIAIGFITKRRLKK